MLQLRPQSLVTGFFSVCVVLGVGACSRPKADTTEVIRPVRVLEVQSAATQVEESFPAQIESRVQAPLSFQVGGCIVARYVELGQVVKKGQVLAKIDPKDVQLGLQAAQAQLDAAQADFAQSKIDLSRSQTLKEKGFVSQGELDRRQLAVDAAQSRVQQAQAQLKVQRNQTQYTTLVAPDDGVIAQVMAEVGQIMAPGQAVFQWVKPSELQARLSIPENKVTAYKPGRLATVKLWEHSDSLKAVVREVSAVADPMTRSYAVKLDLQDPNKAARLGMSATAYFDRKVSDAAFKLPIAALVAEPGGAYVWILDEKNGVVNKRSVRPFDISESDFLVKEELKPGELLVVAGTHVLNDGQKATRFVEAADLTRRAASVQSAQTSKPAQ